VITKSEINDYLKNNKDGRNSAFYRKYQDQERVIVSAANLCSDGLIITGARHLDTIMRATYKALGRHANADEQGFIDQWGNFLTREEAWIVAERQGQIKHRCGGDGKKLYSENLY